MFFHQPSLLFPIKFIFTQPVIDILKARAIHNIYIHDAEYEHGFEDKEGSKYRKSTSKADRKKIMLEIKAIAKNILMNFSNNSFSSSILQEFTSDNSNRKIHKPVENVLEDVSEYVLSNENILNYLMLIRDVDDYTFNHSIKVSAIALLQGINLEYTIYQRNGSAIEQWIHMHCGGNLSQLSFKTFSKAYKYQQIN